MLTHFLRDQLEEEREADRLEEGIPKFLKGLFAGEPSEPEPTKRRKKKHRLTSADLARRAEKIRRQHRRAEKKKRGEDPEEKKWRATWDLPKPRHGGGRKIPSSTAVPAQGDFGDIWKDEPRKPRKPPKPRTWVSAGGVVFDSLTDMTRVWLIKPSHNFGPWSFPKGRIDDGETPKETAIREVREETGLNTKHLPGGYLGKGRGSVTFTHYFAMVRTGGNPAKHDDEVEKVALLSFTEAYKKFKRAGNRRDIAILRKAWEYVNKFRKGTLEKHPGPPTPETGGDPPEPPKWEPKKSKHRSSKSWRKHLPKKVPF